LYFYLFIYYIMLIKKELHKFTGFVEYADKKTWQAKLIINVADEKGFLKPQFLNATPELVEEVKNLTFWDIVVITTDLSLN